MVQDGRENCSDLEANNYGQLPIMHHLSRRGKRKIIITTQKKWLRETLDAIEIRNEANEFFLMTS